MMTAKEARKRAEAAREAQRQTINQYRPELVKLLTGLVNVEAEAGRSRLRIPLAALLKLLNLPWQVVILGPVLETTLLEKRLRGEFLHRNRGAGD